MSARHRRAPRADEPISAAERDADDRGDEPALDHVRDRAGELGAESPRAKPATSASRRARGVGRNTGETSFSAAISAQTRDERREHGEAGEAPGERLHRAAPRRNSRACASSSPG